MKKELERFSKYYEGFQEEENAIKFAKKLDEKIDLYKNVLLTKKNQTNMDIIFLDEALKTVIECHLLLKNTYIFGYYMKSKLNSSLYEHHQEMLRREADLLHEKLEMTNLIDILSIDEKEQFNKEFNMYKEKVQSLMGETIKFKNNILEDIEKHPEYIDYNAIKDS